MAEVVVAGHVCLDVIPSLEGLKSFAPGRLIETGPVTVSTGGAVANTGISLVKLGVDARLIGKVGEDEFAHLVRHVFEKVKPGLDRDLTTSAKAQTSYTIVLNLAGEDRMFLHCPGANETFESADVHTDQFAGCRMFHFGYPPLLKRMFEDDGRELVDLFRKAKGAGMVTSLDMSLPDSRSPSGHANWPKILAGVLPYVDIFLPSVEELLYMLDRRTFDILEGAVLNRLPPAQILKLAESALSLGARMVGLKVGSRGFFLRTSLNLEGMESVLGDLDCWRGLELCHPCFKVEVAGTTGAGDATIAGFLMGLLRGMSPIAACQAAVAVGGCCCEKSDATSGVRSWEETSARIEAGWPTLPQDLDDSWEPLETGFVKR